MQLLKQEMLTPTATLQHLALQARPATQYFVAAANYIGLYRQILYKPMKNPNVPWAPNGAINSTAAAATHTSIWSGGRKPRLPGKCFWRTFFCSSVSGILIARQTRALGRRKRKGSALMSQVLGFKRFLDNMSIHALEMSLVYGMKLSIVVMGSGAEWP
jgi:hypothetical protein